MFVALKDKPYKGVLKVIGHVWFKAFNVRHALPTMLVERLEDRSRNARLAEHKRESSPFGAYLKSEGCEFDHSDVKIFYILQSCLTAM